MEVMITSGFSTMLITLMVSTGYMIDVAKKEFSSHLDMTNQSRIMLDRMAYGYQQSGQSNRRGIAEAVSATLPSSSQIDYTDISSVVHSIRLNSGNIEYRRGSLGTWQTLLDPNGTTVAWDSTKYSTSLTFTQTVPTSVVVKLVLGRKIKGRWYYASATTEIAFRNAS